MRNICSTLQVFYIARLNFLNLKFHAANNLVPRACDPLVDSSTRGSQARGTRLAGKLFQL